MLRVNDTLYDIYDQYTGEEITYNKVTTWIDGSAMTDPHCDGVIFRKLGSEYFKRNYSGPVNPQWFGADPTGIADSTPAFQAAIDAFQSGSALFCGVDILIPRGTYLLADLLIKNGTKLYANQMAKDNSIANVPVIIKAFGTPDYIIDTYQVGPLTSNYSIENLYIDCEYTTQPQLIAGVRLRGHKCTFTGNNVDRAANVAVWSEAGLIYIEKNGIYGWYGSTLPTFTGINDFRGALHCPALGDSYIYDNEIGAGLSYFTSTVTPRDITNGRIVSLSLGNIFGGTSVISGNLFENGDRAVAIGNSLYCNFHNNRYELSALGGLYIYGPLQFASFSQERFADNSLSVDGGADDISIAVGAAGNIVFISPTFESLANVSIPNSNFQVRYNISNFGSNLVDLVTPIVDPTYAALGLINDVDVFALPLRQVKGQYHPDDPQYNSVSTQKLPAETQVGFVKTTQGTDAATQSLVGATQYWTPQNTIAYSIGFSPKEYLSFTGYEPGAIFAYNSNIALQKTGEAKQTIWSTDALGNSILLLQGAADASKQCTFTLNNTTGVSTITASGNIVLGASQNYTLQPNGLTFITATPTTGTISNSFLLGRNTTTTEQVIINPSVFLNTTTTQTAHTVYAGPTGGSPVVPVFRLLDPTDIPVLDTSKITTGTLATARLGTGSPSATTALFGDQTYKTVLTDSTAFINNQSTTDIVSSFRTQGTASIVPVAIGGGIKVNAGTSQITVESGGAALARVQMFTDGVSIVQLRVFDAFNKGFVYEGNYAAAGVLDDRWIPDYKAVKDYVTANTGSVQPIRATSSNDTLTNTDYGLIVDTTAGAVNVALPAAASSVGKQFWLINIGTNGANSMTIDPNGAELINDSATYATNLHNKSVIITSNGTAWYIMASNV